MKFIIPAFLISMLLVGCQSDSERETQSNTLIPTCLDVSDETIEWIELELSDGLSLRNVKAVKSNDFASVYFISGHLVGNQLDGDDIATFSQQNINSTGLVYPIGTVARTHSTWNDGQRTNRVTVSNHGYRESRECVNQ